MPDWGIVGDLAGKATDKIVDTVDSGIDKGKELVGEGVDYVTDKAGQGLRHHGYDSLADDVEDWGDATASSLGAEVGEKQLGQSEEADELIHGKADKIAATVKNLRDFQAAFGLVGGGMKGLDSQNWKGEAAEAFRKRFAPLPTDWLRAADAFGDAAKALESYSKALVSAQGKAREAIALFKEGESDSKAAVDAFNKKVDAYNAARSGDSPLPHPGTFSDPGKQKRARAREILADARAARNTAGETAKSSVTAAMAQAPEEPTGREKLKLEMTDMALGQSIELTHFGGGIIKGTAGIVNFVRSVNPIDPYNLTHPAEYYKGVNMTLAGLVSTAANPDRALKNAWEAAKGDPSEFLGRLVPEIVGTKGAGAVKGLATAGMRSGAKHALTEGAESAAQRGARENPSATSRPEHAVENGASDPIDLATGVMYLPQTDIVLPGVLPLAFHRRVASDYRSGRWFGPSWASTVDQRLEIDAEGVVFVREDGRLIAYPHPAPGVPVLPGHGEPWPLDRSPDGDYTVTDPDSGRVLRFSPLTEDCALLVQVDDRNGHRLTFEYDEAGAPTSIVHSGGYRLVIATEAGRVSSLALAGGAADGSDQRILRYGYTGGHLTEVVNSSGLPLRFSYDERGRVTSWTDTNDSRYDYTYDDLDRCIAEQGEAGHVTLHVDYGDPHPDTGLRVTTTTTGSGAVSRYVINEAHQVVEETDPVGAVTRYERDHRNHLLRRTDPLGRTSRFTYDEAGRPLTAVRPDGRGTEAEYDALGLPVRIVNPDRTVLRYAYDERGNRTEAVAPNGTVARWTYDDAGRLTSATDGLGNTTRVRCDTAGLPVEISDPLGAVTRVERDAFGRPSSITDPLGSVTHFVWTTEGKLARRVEADGSEQSWTYDGEGNCVAHTDPLGQVSRFEYTHFDLLTARTGPDGVRYEFTHDHELRLTQVRNPQGLTWDYTYDAAGRLISESDFDDRPLSYERDAAGALVSRTDVLGQTIRYERDVLGRVVRKDAAGKVTTFAYDFTDGLAEAVNPDATVTFLRDRFGRLVSETVNGRTITFTYDELGRRTGRTTPTGAVSTWTYDAAGRRDALTTAGRTITFEHDAAGQEVARRIGDTLSFTNEYDALGRLTSQQVTGVAGRSIQRRDYAYRADGHLVSLTDQLNGTKTFDLDPIGRVTAVHAANWTERYAYDTAGNQTEASWPAEHPGQEAVGTRDYNGTTLTRAGRVRYEHDALGRVTLRRKPRPSKKPATWRYTWDAEDRMTSAVTPEGVVWRYAYDALGRRIAKRRMGGDGVVERMVFTWEGNVLCEQVSEGGDLSNLVVLSWDHHGTRPVSQTERILESGKCQEWVNSRIFAVSTDLSGAPTELLGENGAVAWRARTSLWGKTAWNVRSDSYIPLRFPGQYFDGETGLHYNFFRHYDPESARYATPDPLGMRAAENPVSYVVNPHAWIDYFGLAPCPNNIGLGYQMADARDWAVKNNFTHYMNVTQIDSWRTLAQQAIDDPSKTIHVYTEGFKGGFEGMAERGLAGKAGVHATQQEMYWLVRSVIGERRSWDTIKFYDRNGPIDIPEPKWYDAKWQKAWLLEWFDQ
ncbi:putative T7SS-secreted protein [Streptomyces zhihengii]|uniref:putative T7SS-secreted protein n=1 Tax=Streptomyces zhihengii TaxID=1818004 RepID=UPI00339F17AF